MSQTDKSSDPAAFGFAPIDVTRPATEQIAAEVRAAILSMQLVPGQMLSESEIGQMFEASRTPVREAFARLREDGLLETRPSRGTFVSMLSEDQTRSAQFLREAIEVSIVERLCRIGLADALAAVLEENVIQQRAAIAEEDRLKFQRLDDEFHALLAEATGLQRLKAALTREKSILDRLRVFALNDTPHMAKLLAEHEAILEAITAKDRDAAVSVVRTHLRRVLALLVELSGTNQDYFETTGG